MSERSVPQLSQASTVEISSTVVVSKFLPVIESSTALVSRFFLGDFLVSSLPVCDGGILEFLLFFWVVFSTKTAIKIATKQHKLIRIKSNSLVILPSLQSEEMLAFVAFELVSQTSTVTSCHQLNPFVIGVRYLEMRATFGSHFSQLIASLGVNHSPSERTNHVSPFG